MCGVLRGRLPIAPFPCRRTRTMGRRPRRGKRSWRCGARGGWPPRQRKRRLKSVNARCPAPLISQPQSKPSKAEAAQEPTNARQLDTCHMWRDNTKSAKVIVHTSWTCRRRRRSAQSVIARLRMSAGRRPSRPGPSACRRRCCQTCLPPGSCYSCWRPPCRCVRTKHP